MFENLDWLMKTAVKGLYCVLILHILPRIAANLYRPGRSPSFAWFSSGSENDALLSSPAGSQAWNIPDIRKAIVKNLPAQDRRALLVLNKDTFEDLAKPYYRQMSGRKYVLWCQLHLHRRKVYANFIVELDLRCTRAPRSDEFLPPNRKHWNTHRLDPTWTLESLPYMRNLQLVFLDRVTLRRTTGNYVFKATHHLRPDVRTIVKDPPRRCSLRNRGFTIHDEEEYTYCVKPFYPFNPFADNRRYRIRTQISQNIPLQSKLIADFKALKGHFARPLSSLAIAVDADLADLVPFFKRRDSQVPLPADLTLYCRSYDLASLGACCETGGSSIRRLELGNIESDFQRPSRSAIHLHELTEFSWSLLPNLEELKIFVKMSPGTMRGQLHHAPARFERLRKLTIVVAEHIESEHFNREILGYSNSHSPFSVQRPSAFLQQLNRMCRDETEVEFHCAVMVRRLHSAESYREWIVQKIAVVSPVRVLINERIKF